MYAAGLCQAQTAYTRLMSLAGVAAALAPAALLAFVPGTDPMQARPELFRPGVAVLGLGVAATGSLVWALVDNNWRLLAAAGAAAAGAAELGVGALRGKPRTSPNLLSKPYYATFAGLVRISVHKHART